jgi:3-dehydroquinate synthase
MITPQQVTQVRVELSERAYDIHISSGAWQDVADRLVKDTVPMTHAVVIADENVRDRWAQPLMESLIRSTVVDLAKDPHPPLRISFTTVPSGENSKSIQQYERLLDWMLTERTDRQSVVIAIGGGVVGDLAGFVAASFTRGLRFVQIPTTLLAMVDSSVGGKTGINLPSGKNMVGAFWQPQSVIINTDVLSTLPPRDYVSGLAEVIKYGVIDDQFSFDWLESHADDLARREPAAVRHAIAESCRSKARVVSVDERETTGLRAILNYGHTFAHAIEATAGYGTFLHGEAVAIGMQMAARLAIDLGLCDTSVLTRQTAVLSAVGLPLTWPQADPDAMLPIMGRDKKVAHGKLRFILPTRIGQVKMVGDVDSEKVIRAIQATR